MLDGTKEFLAREGEHDKLVAERADFGELTVCDGSGGDGCADAAGVPEGNLGSEFGGFGESRVGDDIAHGGFHAGSHALGEVGFELGHGLFHHGLDGFFECGKHGGDVGVFRPCVVHEDGVTSPGLSDAFGVEGDFYFSNDLAPFPGLNDEGGVAIGVLADGGVFAPRVGDVGDVEGAEKRVRVSTDDEVNMAEFGSHSGVETESAVTEEDDFVDPLFGETIDFGLNGFLVIEDGDSWNWEDHFEKVVGDGGDDTNFLSSDFDDGGFLDCLGEIGEFADVEVGSDDGESGEVGKRDEGLDTPVEFVVADSHSLVADEVHEGEVSEAFVFVEIKGALEDIAGVEDEWVDRFFAAVDQDRGLTSVSADGFPPDGDRLDMGVEVIGVKNGYGEVLSGGILLSNGYGAGEESTEEKRSKPFHDEVGIPA